MVAMILAVSVVTLASYELVRKQVQVHFEEALQQQYGKQFTIFQERKFNRLKAVTNEIITNTSNPRLLAALYEDDYSRFYYDLGQELKPFYQNLEFNYSDTRVWPFFRFIRADGQYLVPPSVSDVGVEAAVDTLPGIMAPIPEDELKEMFTGLRTVPSDSLLDARTGYLVATLSGNAAKPTLLEAFVCPILDAFGTFIGDLIVVIPWRGDEIAQLNTLSVIVTEGLVFSATDGHMDHEEWNRLGEQLQDTKRSLIEQTALIANEPYLIFSKGLGFDTRFPFAQQATLFSLREQEMLEQSIANILLLIVAGGLGFSLLLSIGVAHGLNAPLFRLKEAVLKIGSGDFSARVESSSNDEIGELSEAFNQMAEDLTLKERYKNVLSQVTDTRVANQLIHGEVELGGISLDVTILFCDIRGFTDFASNMDPHLLVEVLNQHMTAMTKIAHKHGGVVDKFVGDEIMVLFGAPVPGEDDICQAFACAQEMIECRREMNESVQHSINIGIGLAHGPVIAGCMGSRDRLNYTVIGKAVNLASRLCSEAGKMEITLDAALRAHLGEQLPVAVERKKPIKGFEGVTTFYTVSTETKV